jgi:hypothetical protein
MHTKRKRVTKVYPRSEGNLALTVESLGVFHKPKALPLSLTLTTEGGVAQNTTDEASKADSLAPAVGMIIGVGLSIVLWSLIVLVIFRFI